MLGWGRLRRMLAWVARGQWMDGVCWGGYWIGWRGCRVGWRRMSGGLESKLNWLGGYLFGWGGLRGLVAWDWVRQGIWDKGCLIIDRPAL